MQEMVHFLNVYKQLEYKNTTALDVFDRQTAEDIIEQNIIAYKEKFAK